jgi:hypothetical protein
MEHGTLTLCFGPVQSIHGQLAPRKSQVTPSLLPNSLTHTGSCCSGAPAVQQRPQPLLSCPARSSSSTFPAQNKPGSQEGCWGGRGGRHFVIGHIACFADKCSDSHVAAAAAAAAAKFLQPKPQTFHSFLNANEHQLADAMNKINTIAIVAMASIPSPVAIFQAAQRQTCFSCHSNAPLSHLHCLRHRFRR